MQQAPPEARFGPVHIRLVFDTWRDSTERFAPPRMSKRQEALILRALQHLGLEDTLDAVVAWRYSPRLCGRNPLGRVYWELERQLGDLQRAERLAQQGRRAREAGAARVPVWVRGDRLCPRDPARRGMGHFSTGVRVLS
jgi:hypothetical protein